MPDRSDATWVIGAVGIGENEYRVERVPSWAVPGAKAILLYKDLVELRTVSDIDGADPYHITFEEENTVAWPDRTRIAPAVYGRLADDQSAQQFASGTAEMTLSFEAAPGFETVVEPGEPEEMFNGREVFLEKANWANGRDVNFLNPREVVDYGFGRIRVVQPIKFVATMRTADYLAKTAEQARRVLDFFKRQKGRRGEFYAPSDSADIEAYSITGSTIRVRGEDFANAYGDDPVNKAVSLRLLDGTRLFRLVDSITPSGHYSDILLTESLSGVTAADVEIISWLPVLRNGSDTLTIEWNNDEVAEMRLTFLTLEALEVEEVE